MGNEAYCFRMSAVQVLAVDMVAWMDSFVLVVWVVVPEKRSLDKTKVVSFFLLQVVEVGKKVS